MSPALILALTLSAQAPTEPSPGSAADALKVLEAVDNILAPPVYEGDVTMSALRPDGSKRDYRYHVYKSGDDKLLLTFDEPRVLDGHSVMRKGEDLWRYIPSLKRAVRVSSRSDFEGGDFRNADVLRVHIARDYKATELTTTKDGLLRVDAKAATKDAAYDRAVVFARPDDKMPVRIEYYAESGKHLRTLLCQDVHDFDGHRAPRVLEMQNEVAKGRKTIMTLKTLDTKATVPDSRFRVQKMGR